MLPYDGSPGGNALGMQIDEQRQHHHEAVVEAGKQDSATPVNALSILTFAIGASVVLYVMFHGTLG